MFTSESCPSHALVPWCRSNGVGANSARLNQNQVPSPPLAPSHAAPRFGKHQSSSQFTQVNFLSSPCRREGIADLYNHRKSPTSLTLISLGKPKIAVVCQLLGQYVPEIPAMTSRETAVLVPWLLDTFHRFFPQTPVFFLLSKNSLDPSRNAQYDTVEIEARRLEEELEIKN